MGCCEPARNTSKGRQVFAAASRRGHRARLYRPRTTGGAAERLATPFGSMIMITVPSPRIVVPEKAAMWRSFDDIGLITISSVWNTPSTTTPKIWLPTCSHDNEACGRSRCSIETAGFPSDGQRQQFIAQAQHRRVFDAFDAVLPAADGAHQVRARESCGIAKRSPPASTMSAETIASVSGILIVNVVPGPGADFKSTVPPICSMLARTTSMPTPRPEMLVTCAGSGEARHEDQVA